MEKTIKKESKLKDILEVLDLLFVPTGVFRFMKKQEAFDKAMGFEKEDPVNRAGLYFMCSCAEVLKCLPYVIIGAEIISKYTK